MRYLVLFVLPLTLAAQTAEPDQRITQTLISEIQQLRLAIERSTLLGARTQLALGQLQMQETAVARLSQQLNDVRVPAPEMAGRRARLTEEIRNLEQQRGAPQIPNGPTKDDIELKIKEEKIALDQANAAELNRSMREGELTAQFQAAQGQIADSRNRIAEMERALDAAIQQLLKQK
jgi:predicted  nucleic acid-binding Zn-ribbon protein